MLKGLSQALLATVALAAVSTLGDLAWANWVPDHRAAFGLAHGTLLGAAIGLALGLARGRVLAGIAGGAAIVLGAALGFYALRPLLGYSGMLVCWMALWLAFGLLGGRWLGRVHSTAQSLTRGALAAVGSGLAFYLISGIWTRFSPQTIDYPYHLACWAFAFLPAFLALLVERRSSPGTTGPSRPCSRPAPRRGGRRRAPA